MAKKWNTIWAADIRAVRGLFFMNMTLIILAPLIGLVTITPQLVLFSVGLYYLFGCLGIVASFHRFHSHNSFEFKRKSTEILWTLLGHLAGSGSALGWVAIHRLHHKAPDTEKDPHSPIHGVWPTLTADYHYGDSHWRNLKDMMAKDYVVILHKYYFMFLLCYTAALYIIGGFGAVYYCFTLPSAITLAMSGFTNYVAHLPWLGYQSYSDAGHSTNTWWSAIFNCGEGWHNNHHHDPANFTTKHRWWEFDMAGSAIRLVKTNA